MGYLRHEAIVVNGWDADQVDVVQAAAVEIFTRHELGGLVSPVIRHAANGGGAFFVSPDGSKEGWAPSHAGDKARRELIDYMTTGAGRELYVDWCHLLIGGDDGEYRVLASPELVMEE